MTHPQQPPFGGGRKKPKLYQKVIQITPTTGQNQIDDFKIHAGGV